MKEWTADDITLWKMIGEWLKYAKSARLYALKDWGEDVEDLKTDILLWIKSAETNSTIMCREAFDGSYVTAYEVNRERRQRVKICCMAFITDRYSKAKGERKMKKNFIKMAAIEEITGSDWDGIPVWAMIKVMKAEKKFTKEEEIVLRWKLDIISGEDAQSLLKCSERTLYNRWNGLKNVLLTYVSAEDKASLGIPVRDPLKSLDLFYQTFPEVSER